MMSFLETVAKARSLLEHHRRISLTALKLEFALEDTVLESLVSELIDAERVAVRDGETLVWASPGSAPDPAPNAGGRQRIQPLLTEGERRQVVIVFADLAQSTRISQMLDPEALRDVVRTYQDVATRIVARYDGYIAQYMGDGILAYFGYPLSHDDDAYRAVRAALEIPEALAAVNDQLLRQYGVTLGVRVGVHVGAVVVGEMGRGQHRERLAVGDAPNIAARLQSEAQPGEVVMSAATLRLVPGLFLTEDLGFKPLKGLSEPIRIHRALQPSGVPGRLRHVRALTPFAGREQEIEFLLDRWASVEGGSGQVVLVSGEAGIGKSRLLDALRERLANRPYSWLECAASEIAASTAFQPFIELLQEGLGLADKDLPQTRLSRLEIGIELTGLDTTAVLPSLASLLSLPIPEEYGRPVITPELRRSQTIDALVAWCIALARRQPVVLLIDDLHWADPSTLETLGALIERLPTARLLLLATFRPGFHPPWPARPSVFPLALAGLGRRQVARVIDGIAGGRPFPEHVADHIFERSGGIALFVEELTRAVLDSGVLVEKQDRYELMQQISELPVPATLQSLLMARLDRLGDAKEVAQVAATLGMEFNLEVLAAVTEIGPRALREKIARLVTSELVHRRKGTRDATFVFRHSLIHATAYESLLRSVRSRLHHRIATVLEDRFPARAAAEPELLARHWEKADQPGPSAAYHRLAAERAEARSAHEEALSHLNRGLAMIATLPPGADRNRSELALLLSLVGVQVAALGFAHDDIRGTLVRMRTLMPGLEDAPEYPQTLIAMLSFHTSRAEHDAAIELGNRIIEYARDRRDDVLELGGHSLLGIPTFYRHGSARALSLLETVIRDGYDPERFRAVSQIFGYDLGVLAHGYAALAQWQLGSPDRALHLAKRGLEIADACGHALSVPLAMTMAGWVHWLRGELVEAREQATRTIEVGERQRAPFYVAMGKLWYGLALSDVDAARGAELVREATAGVLFKTFLMGSASRLRTAAITLHRAGFLTEARCALDRAFEAARSTGEAVWLSDLHRVAGELASDPAAAEAEFERALAIAREQQAKSVELRTATHLARLRHEAGRSVEARDLLAPVYASFSEGLETYDLREARELLQRLDGETGVARTGGAPTS